MEPFNSYYESITAVSTQSLPDLPDLSGMTEDRPEPWADGWYTATVEQSHAVTREGMEVTYATKDVPSRDGQSRNLQIRLVVTRKSDGRTMHTKTLINYRQSDFSAETLSAVQTRKAEVKVGGEWGPMFRPFQALTSIGSLQRIAAIRQFQRTADGGFDLTPLFGKSVFVRMKDDEAGRYKDITAISDTAPKKGTL